MNRGEGDLRVASSIPLAPKALSPNVPAFSPGRVRRLIYEGAGPERLDRFVADFSKGLTRSQVKRLTDSGLVLINGKRAKAGAMLHRGDVVTVTIPPSPPSALRPEPIPLKILHEDPWLLVIDKPAGMVAHPGPGHRSGTIVHALLAHCPGIHTVGGPQRAGLVHRLDKETSGVMVVAKTDEVHQELSRQFKNREVLKEYVALVHGTLGEARGTIDLPLGRDLLDRKRISPRTSKPRTAITHWRVLRRFPSCTLLKVVPETGRTHQIRVHLVAMNHPVVGDATYGRRALTKLSPDESVRKALRSIRRQFLHAERLSFDHPKEGARRTFRAALPSDLIEILRVSGMEEQEIFDNLGKGWL